MAFNNIYNRVETYIAGEDLTSAQYRFLKTDAAGAVVVAGAGEDVVGICWNDPAAGRATSVVRGNSDPHVYAGAAIAVGVDIAVDANGAAVAADTGDFIVGKTRYAAAAAGDLVQINFNPVGTISA
jgi:hypothetical protein